MTIGFGFLRQNTMLNNFSSLCSCISRHWEVYFRNRFWELIAPITAPGFVKFGKVDEIFWEEVFMLKNILKRATTLMIGQFGRVRDAFLPH